MEQRLIKPTKKLSFTHTTAGESKEAGNNWILA